MLKFAKKNLTQFILLTSSVALVSSVFMASKSNSIDKARVVQNGIGTCFSRVATSFTAKMIGQSGSGMTSGDFTTASESCFSDLLEMVEQNFSAALGTTQNSFHQLASNVHWFHEKIKLTEESEEVYLDVNQRFNDLENRKFEIEGSFSNFIASQTVQYETLKIIFFTFLAFSGILYLIQVTRSSNRISFNKEIEADSSKFLNNEQIDGEAWEDVISDALENNDMYKTSQLFKKMAEGGLSLSENTSDNKVVINKTDELVSKFKGLSCNLEDVMTSVVDQASFKIFESGVFLDIEDLGGVKLRLETEAVGQALFNTLDYFLKSIDSQDDEKKIRIYTKKENQSIALFIEAFGTIVNSDDLEYFNATDDSELKSLNVSTELKIVKELLPKDSVKTIAYNSFSDNDSSATIKFELPEIDQRKALVDLKKGKKADVLRSMNS